MLAWLLLLGEKRSHTLCSERSCGLCWQQGGNSELRDGRRSSSASSPAAPAVCALSCHPPFSFLVSCKAQEQGQAVLLTAGAGMWDPQLSLHLFLKGCELLPLELPKVRGSWSVSWDTSLWSCSTGSESFILSIFRSCLSVFIVRFVT